MTHHTCECPKDTVYEYEPHPDDFEDPRHTSWRQLHSKASMLRPGWSPMVGVWASSKVPRSGAPWTRAEELDLQQLAERRAPMIVMERMHGRTSNALMIRLDKLGISIDYWLAEDFPQPVIKHPKPSPLKTFRKAKPMKMTTARLIALLQTFEAGQEVSATSSETAASLNILALAGLLAKQPSGGFLVSSAGKAMVESLVDSVSSAPVSAQPSVEPMTEDGGEVILRPQRFYVTVPGLCDIAAINNSNPPVELQLPKTKLRVYSSLYAAEKAAKLQASETTGMPMFVLQAVSTHKVSLAPVEVTRL